MVQRDWLHPGPIVLRCHHWFDQSYCSGSTVELLGDVRLTNACRFALNQLSLKRSFTGNHPAAVSSEIVSDGVHVPNEDVGGGYSATFWRLDGASQVDPDGVRIGTADVAGFCARFSDSLLDLVKRNGDIEISSLVTKAFEELVDRFGTTQFGGASAAIAICQVRGGVLHSLSLADCSVVATSASGDLELMDDPISKAREAYLCGLRSLRQDISSALRRRRRLANKTNGYWVLSSDSAPLEWAQERYLALSPRCRVLMCSDGFARVVETFQLATWRELTLDPGISLTDLVAQLRSAEAADSGCVVYPRISRADDATAIRLIPGTSTLSVESVSS